MQTLVFTWSVRENNGWNHSDMRVSPESFKSAFWCEILISMNRKLSDFFFKSLKNKKKPTKTNYVIFSLWMFRVTSNCAPQAFMHLIWWKCSKNMFIKLQKWGEEIKSSGHFRSAHTQKNGNSNPLTSHTCQLKTHSHQFQSCRLTSSALLQLHGLLWI